VQKQASIVLHKYPYGESSFILKVLTEDFGLVSLIAKGAKKPKSPFYGQFDAPHLLELVYYDKAGRQLHTLGETSLIKSRSHYQNELMHSALTLVLREIILKSIHEGEGAHEIFELLDVSLSWSEAQEVITPLQSYIILGRYIYRFAQIMGFGIQYENCQNCQTKLKLDRLHHLDFSEGGFLCTECQLDHIHIEIPPWLQACWLLLKTPSSLQEEHIHLLSDVEEILIKYLWGHLHISSKIKSRDYLNQIRMMV
jgi:DNA repair protein RecO (recombination protein O)